MEKSCEYCQSPLYKKKNESEKYFVLRKFCDRRCFSESTKCLLNCSHCNKEYRVSPIRASKSQFCSMGCYLIDRRSKVKPPKRRQNFRKKNEVLFDGEKECTKCHIIKNRVEFFVDRIQRDGRSPECKKCSYVRRAKIAKNDINFIIKRRLRNRIYETIKYGKKSDRTFVLLGCTFPEFKKHLESKFKDGMTWENYGEWHIDHIKPCSLFNLADPEEQKVCFHYTNMQPLWARENIIKGNRYVF